MIFKYVGDGAASNLMPEISQCASNSRVSPRGIFKRHAKNEIDDRFHDAWPARAAPVAVVPLGGLWSAKTASRTGGREELFLMLPAKGRIAADSR